MRRRHRPISSYRLQFNRQLRFEDAERLTPYLDRLGITDCYASPLLAAVPGSEHGYDTCDYSVLNPDLGAEADFERFAGGLASREMGLIVDFVPNHMALDARCNRWWRDVLTHGQRSAFAAFFDIDWERPRPEPQGRILLPILEDGYGEVLERGEIRLLFDADEFAVGYYERRLPLRPETLATLFDAVARHLVGNPAGTEAAAALNALRQLLDNLANGAVATDDQLEAMTEVRGQMAALAQLPLVRSACERVSAEFNGQPADASSFDALDRLLDEQHYRLAHWKTSFDEINYRRFFDINNLGAIRMENPCVFAATHRKVLQLIAAGQVTGLRLDHTDGLLDPAGYFAQLQQAIAALPGHSPLDSTGQDRFHLVAEKILARDELLPSDWQISGTTGYGFLNDVSGLFVDATNKAPLERLYARVTGRRDAFSQVAYHARRLVTASSMASELNVLARHLKTIAMADRRTRDYTVTALRRAIAETVACMPVYRSYITEHGFTAADREIVDHAIDRARRTNPVMAQAVFLFLRRVLLSEPQGDDDRMHPARRRFAMRFQQFSAPVQAKGIEDTAFYRYQALIALNEVGGDPSHFGVSPDAFHAGNRVRLERWRHEMITTATHDTKRGEDARARLCVLSEVPDEWRAGLARWRKINALRRTAVDRKPAPEPNDEYLFYQALCGSWPAEALDAPLPAEAPPEFVERIKSFMQKAIKEAKTHTSWINQNRAYEDAVSYFVETTLRGATAGPFLASFVPFARMVARAGMVNSLAQLALKITSPGVPDFYQGTEGWQLDFADPDNRRPVDFAERERTLAALSPWVERAEAAPVGHNEATDLGGFVQDLVAEWSDGRIKMFVMAVLLRLRRARPELFIDGGYAPLRADGPAALHLVSFARILDQQMTVTVVPRLRHTLTTLHPEDSWRDTRILLPPSAEGRHFVHAITGDPITPDAGSIRAAALFRHCPIAVLIEQESSSHLVS